MAFLVHALLLSVSSMAASDIVRRESKHASVSLHLGANGQFIDHENRFDEAGHRNSYYSMPQETVSTKINTCDDDFPLGNLNANTCKESGFDYPILSREVCIEAAQEAHVMTVHSKFEIQEEGNWRNKHPRGCFKIQCSEAHAATGHAAGANASDKADAATAAATGTATGVSDSAGYCYFYNPVGNDPTEALTGVPVCFRPKIVNGTIEDKSAENGPKNAVSCKAGFESITTQDDCRRAATCLGLCSGHLFDISAEVNSLYEDYPDGCFIEAQSGCVYINEKPANWALGATGWNTISGTPLCNVTEVTLANSWPSGEMVGDTPATQPAAAATDATQPATGDDAATDAAGGDAAAGGNDADAAATGGR